MERVDVSEDVSVAELRQELVERGLMLESSILRFQQQNLTDEGASLHSLGCKNGDIFEIKDRESVKTSNSSSRSRVRSKSEGPRTLDDIKLAKAKLLKITSQKLSQEMTVAVSPSTGEDVEIIIPF